MLIKFFIFFLLTNVALSQHKSIHQLESEFYQRNPELVGKDIFYKVPGTDFDKVTALSHKVYGFHPYWISDATASNYYYSLLTHVAYFSAEVDNSNTSTGGFSTTRNWATTQVVNYCKANGVKIHLCVTMFSNHQVVLSNPAYRINLINNIITQVNLRSADGVNLDFESVSSTQKNNFRLFVIELGTALKNLNLELVVCLPAVDWSNIYDSNFFATTSSVVDYYFIMAYDYYWSGSTTAGPVSPLTSGISIRHVTRTITDYNGVGLPSSKMLVGFNYYGYEWPVSGSARMASTTGTGVARTFSYIKSAISSIPAADKFFDGPYNSPWYRFQVGSQWYQTWYDDSLSLSRKYDSIKARNCAGTGMWALGYGGSYTDLWGALKEAFASKSIQENIILADFETGPGIFNNQPTFSGSTVGISTSSSSQQTYHQALNGWASMKIILIDNPSSSSNWTVRFLAGGGNPANNQTLSSNGYIGFWLKTSTAPSGAQVAVTIDDGAGGTELSPKLNVINNGEWNLYQWNLQGPGWTNFAGGNGIINGPTVTLDAIMFYAPNNSPDWTIYIDDVSYNSTSPLPVELRLFVANVVGRNVHLSWQTETEINNFGFEIQRRKINDDWTNIHFVQGNGNSNSRRYYKFIDESLDEGVYQYRLKQIDFNGNFNFSETVEVEIVSTNDFYLYQNYPNPFNPSTHIRYKLPSLSNVRLRIFNLNGELVEELVNEKQEAGSYYVIWTPSKEIASGVYFYRLEATSLEEKTKSFVDTKKLMFIK